MALVDYALAQNETTAMPKNPATPAPAPQPAPAGPAGPPRAAPLPQQAAPQGNPQVRTYTPPAQNNAPGGVNNPNSNASTEAQQWLKEQYDRLSSLGTPGWQDFYNKLSDQYSHNLQGTTATDTSANYYRKDSAGNVWQTTPGSPSGFQYGSITPTPGVDVRDWSHINNPLAYQYGGQYGGAAAEQNRYAQMGQAAGGNAAAQMNLGAFNGIAGQYGGDTNNALSMLQRQASGQGPSIADAQMQQGLAQSRQAQMQQAASARGGGANLVAAEQLAGSNASQQQSASIGQGAVARAQEQLGAQQAYGNLANQAYATQGGLAAQIAQNQAGFQQGQNQLNQQGQLAYEAMRQGVFNSQMTAQQAAEAANSGAYQFGQNQNMQQQAMDNANRNALVGGLMTAGGTVLGTLVGGPAGGVAGGMAGGALGKSV